MTWVHLQESVCSQASAESTSGSDSPGHSTEPSATSSGTPTASKSCKPESETDTLMTPPYGTTLPHSTGDRGVDAWIASLAASPARISHAQASGQGSKASAQASGGSSPGSLARWDRDSRCWRTCQALDGICDPSCQNCDDWDMQFLAKPLPQPPSWVRVIFDGALSSLPSDVIARPFLPTPTHTINGGNRGGSKGRTGAYRPSVYRILNAYLGGPCHPAFFDWLMGVPIGWTALEPLATPSYQQWCAHFCEASERETC